VAANIAVLETFSCPCIQLISTPHRRMHAVSQLFEALCHRRPRVRWPMVSSFRTHCGPGVDSAPGRNEYRGIFPGG